MAAKYQLITELYRRTGMAVAKNPQAWQGFLSSACHNYKCRFDEQLLIYAQRPDATAVAEIGTWNRLFKRWVNKDSKGIAVFDPKGRRNTLKYYFDVSDTHEGYYGSRAVPIWQMDKRYEQPVMERLADRFGGTEGGDFATFLMQTAENAVEDNLPDYLSQLKGCTKDSFLEELDDYNIEVIYKRLAANSVAYMLLNRCGLDAGGYFEREDFAEITNFNTPQTLNAIGIATSDISEMALREISAAVRNVQIEARGQNRTFARNIAKEEEAFFTGNGTGKPLGVLAVTGGAETGVTAASSTAVTADELMDLYYSLKSPYRKKSVWVLNDSTIKAIRKLKDNNGQYLWQPSLVAGTPDTILGRPVKTSAYMPAIAAGAKTIAFGDFSYYWIADRQGRSFKRLNELYAATGQVGFLASQRVDGKLILAEAVKVLAQKAASGT